MTKKKKATFVSFLLDETGSMQSIKDDTIGGFNAYVETLAKGGADILFSLVSFNSNDTRRRYVAEPIGNVSPLTIDDYVPEAMTPLIDAAVKIIKATDEAVAERGDDPNVVIVMQTDGQENVSVEYSNVDLAALIKEKKAAGWEFVFLGAGLDAFAAARAAGIELRAEQVVSYDRNMSHQVFAATADNVMEFADLGDPSALSYSAAQRSSVGDRHTKKYLDADGTGQVGADGKPSQGARKKARPTRPPAHSTADDMDLKAPGDG